MCLHIFASFISILELCILYHDTLLCQLVTKPSVADNSTFALCERRRNYNNFKHCESRVSNPNIYHCWKKHSLCTLHGWSVNHVFIASNLGPKVMFQLCKPILSNISTLNEVLLLVWDTTRHLTATWATHVKLWRGPSRVVIFAGTLLSTPTSQVGKLIWWIPSVSTKR